MVLEMADWLFVVVTTGIVSLASALHDLYTRPEIVPFNITSHNGNLPTYDDLKELENRYGNNVSWMITLNLPTPTTISYDEVSRLITIKRDARRFIMDQLRFVQILRKYYADNNLAIESPSNIVIYPILVVKDAMVMSYSPEDELVVCEKIVSNIKGINYIDNKYYLVYEQDGKEYMQVTEARNRYWAERIVKAMQQ